MCRLCPLFVHCTHPLWETCVSVSSCVLITVYHCFQRLLCTCVFLPLCGVTADSSSTKHCVLHHQLELVNPSKKCGRSWPSKSFTCLQFHQTLIHLYSIGVVNFYPQLTEWAWVFVKYLLLFLTWMYKQCKYCCVIVLSLYLFHVSLKTVGSETVFAGLPFYTTHIVYF